MKFKKTTRESLLVLFFVALFLAMAALAGEGVRRYAELLNQQLKFKNDSQRMEQQAERPHQSPRKY